MANSLISFTFFCLSCVLLANHDSTYSPTFPISINSDRQSHHQFNFKEKINSPDATVIKAVAIPSDSHPFAIKIHIASVNINDDPLTNGPNPNLKLFVNSCGFYSMSSKEGSCLYFTVQVIFTNGIYSQSFVVVMGRVLIIENVRELPMKGSNIIQHKIHHTSQGSLPIALPHHKFFLNNPPQIPALSHYLISIQNIISKYKCSTSINIGFNVKDISSNQTPLQGISQNRLYPLPPISPTDKFIALSAQQSKPSLWQTHLGHPYILLFASLVKPFKITCNQHTPLLCTSCNVAISNNLTFMPCNFSTSKDLKLVHVGVWRPSIIPSLNRYQCDIIFVIDFLRFCWLLYIYDKSNTFLIFIHFSLMAENSLNLLPSSNSILLSTNKQSHNPISPTPYLNLTFPTKSHLPNTPNSNIFASDNPIPSSPLPPTNTHPIITHLKSKKLKQEHIFPLAAYYQTITIPSSFSQASKTLEWRRAMSNKFLALVQQGMWSVVPPSLHHHVFGCCWTYKTRLKSVGSINFHKALLIAQGFKQKYNIDYYETLRMVAKMPTILLLPTIVLHNNWSNHQLYVSNVFFYGKLQEVVYPSQMLGFIDTATKDADLFVDAFIFHH